MLNKNYTAKLLDLEDVIVTNVETISGELRVYLELPRTKHVCPACGTLTDCVHDYRMQTVKDIPLGRKTLLYLRKRRYQKSEHNTMSPGQPQHDISNTLPLSRPDCRKFSLSTNSRATPEEKSTTALSWTPKNVKQSIFYQIDLRTSLSNISHSFHLKPT